MPDNENCHETYQKVLDALQGFTFPDEDPPGAPGVAPLRVVSGVGTLVGIILLLLALLGDCLEELLAALGVIMTGVSIYGLVAANRASERADQIAEMLDKVNEAKGILEAALAEDDSPQDGPN